MQHIALKACTARSSKVQRGAESLRDLSWLQIFRPGRASHRHPRSPPLQHGPACRQHAGAPPPCREQPGPHGDRLAAGPAGAHPHRSRLLPARGSGGTLPGMASLAAGTPSTFASFNRSICAWGRRLMHGLPHNAAHIFTLIHGKARWQTLRFEFKFRIRKFKSLNLSMRKGGKTRS